jgi:hypothetical protein
MQPCPECGSPLPDKAIFCANCGYALAQPNDQVSQHPQAPKSAEAKQTPVATEERAQNQAPALPDPPHTPLPETAELLEKQQTILLPPPLKTPLPPQQKAGQQEKGGAFPPPPMHTPLPPSAPAVEGAQGQQGQQGQAASGKPARNGSPVKVERQNTKRPETPKQPAPLSPEEKKAAIEELQTVAMPRPQQPTAPSSGGAPDIESLSTRVMPAVGKTPLPPTPPKAPAEQERHGGIDGQKTIPVTAVSRAPQGGPPGPRPPASHPAVVYRGGPQTSKATRRGQTQTALRTLPPGSTVKAPAPPPTLVGRVRKFIWRWISPIFTRALDPEPEKPQKVVPQGSLLGWLPVMAVTCALGLFTVDTAFNASRANQPGAELYYWLGLGLIFVPALVRILLPQASRVERIGLICVVATCLFLTKVTISPFHYSGYDETLHLVTLNDIVNTKHLFTKNPLLPVSPYYPGLEIVASALCNLSGMNTLQAGYTVAGVATLLMVLCIFILSELLSRSARLASIAAMIYMTNPHFLFFDTQFAYETLALPLATFVMFAMTRYEMLNSSRRWVLLAAWFVLIALDVTHHVTNFLFEGMFLFWAAIYLFMRPLPLRKSIVIFTIGFGLVVTVLTVLLIGNTVISYFTSFFSDLGTQIAKTLGNSSSDSRQLFGSTGTPTPLWERLVSLGSVGLITMSTPFFLLCFWRRYRRITLLWVLAVIVIFYPILQVLRLTSSGAEISDRSSPFIFIGISFLAAVSIVQYWPVRKLTWRQPALISAVILVIFMGGIILGEGIPATFLPGPYEVSADGRSIDPEGIQAALWSYTYLGPKNRVFTDRANQLMESVYGDQYVVTNIGDGIELSDVFFEATMSSDLINKLRAGEVHFLFVDMRLTTAPPVVGFYFEQGETAEVLTPALLNKFDAVPQINRLFDSGNIVVYDTGELINAPQKP